MLIEIKNLTKRFGCLEVLKGNSVKVKKGEVLSTMRQLAEKGMTMICVTHEMRFACDVVDRVAYFQKGVIAEVAPPRQIFGDPQSEHTRKYLSSTR